MRRHTKIITAVLLSSAIMVTTAWGGILLRKSSAEGKQDVIPAECLNTGQGNITYGTNLYVWSGDRAFDPENYHPDGNIGENESVTYEEGSIDLTPGAVSNVTYRITDEKGESRLKLYTFTAVSDKSSSTVRSGMQDDVIYGLERTPSFGGQVPADYTECGITHDSEDVISIARGTGYRPELSYQNYDSDGFVMSLSDGNVDTTKPGTYTLTYNVSPRSDAGMYWNERYTVKVTDSKGDNMGVKVVAGDNVIHATVTDENGNDTEVYMGHDYNLNAGVKNITVQNRRGHEAEAEVTVKKNGRTIDESEVIKSIEKSGDNLVIVLKREKVTDGIEISLESKNVMSELTKRPDNAVDGGWDNNANTGIETDDGINDGAKTRSIDISEIMGSVLGTRNVMAATNMKQGSVLTAVTGVSASHTCEEYHNGAPTGVMVADGVQLALSKKKLAGLIDDLASKEGLGVVSTGDIPTAMYLNCVDHGDAGYYMSQLTRSMLSYVNAYLRRDGDTYYMEIVGEYHAAGRQRLMGAVKIQLEKKPAYLMIEKKTDAGGEAGVVEGAVYGVFATEAGAKSGKNPMMKLVLNRDGKSTTTAGQAGKLRTDTRYYIRELSNPKGTYLNTKVYSVRTTKDGTSKTKAVRLKTKNRPWRTRISVHKKEKVTGKDLSGAEFTVYQWNGKKYEKAEKVGNGGVITTDSTGNASTGWLYYTKKNLGKWRITETRAPKNHRNNRATRDIQINRSNAQSSEEEPLSWTVENEETVEEGRISVQKVVTDANGRDVSDDYDMTATFTVYSDSACRNVVTGIRTDGRNGYGISDRIAVGTYYVKETSWNAGYEPADRNAVKEARVTKDSVFKIEAGVSTQAREVGNQVPWYAGLEARKTDATTGDPLGGAEFTFYEWNGRKYVPLVTRKSGDDGIARIDVSEHLVRWTKTNRGRFAVAETAAPEGCMIDDTSMKETVINRNNRGTVITFASFGDTKMGYLDMNKVIVDGLGNRDSVMDASGKFAGIIYGLYHDAECTSPVSGLDCIRIDRNGHFKSGALVPGTYYLKEKSLNTAIFANSAGLKMRVTIYPGKTTYLDGEKGVSYDNKTWDDTIW